MSFLNTIMNMKFPELVLIGGLFNGLPGPFIAKICQLWLIYHLVHGNYHNAVKELHGHFGDVVQIGPKLFSLSTKKIVYIPHLIVSAFPVHDEAYKQLSDALTMANIFNREADIDTCMRKVLDLMQHVLSTGQPVDLGPLLTNFAYEIFILTTTGQRAGFLDCVRDDAKTRKALANWKQVAVLQGLYLRYHPFISSVLRFLGHDARRAGDEVFGSSIDLHGDQLNKTNPILQCTNLETRIALTLAGADPTITLLHTSLKEILRDGRAELRKALRDELAASGLSAFPAFSSIILATPRLQLLWGCVQECARLTPPQAVGPAYLVRKAGVVAGDHTLPAGSMVLLEQTTSHLDQASFGEDAADWNPHRWLNFATNAPMKRNLLAFNISAGEAAENIESFQFLLAFKLVIQVILRFENDAAIEYHTTGVPSILEVNDETPEAVAPSNETNLPATLVDSHTTSVPSNSTVAHHTTEVASSSSASQISDEDSFPTTTACAADRLVAYLGKEMSDILLNGRFAPKQKHYRGQQAVITTPLVSGFARAMVHASIKLTHQGRLQTWSHPDNKTMAIGPNSSIPAVYRHKKRFEQGKRPQRANQAPRAQRPAQQHGQAPRNAVAVNAVWGSFAQAEGERVDYTKSSEGWAERKEFLKKQQENPQAAPEKLITVFKQRGKPAEKTDEKPKATIVPPHLRAKQEKSE